MDSKTRVTLLDRLRNASDHLSWEDFFQRYWPLMYASARHRGCSEHTAEEVVQDVMLSVFNERDIFQYDPARGRFRDWLHRVVRNKVVEFRRRPSERIRPAGGSSDPAVKEAEADEPQPDDAWEAAFESSLLTVLLDAVRREINPRAYLAFELAALGDLPVGQIARVTGMTRNAVYKTRKRVFNRLVELGAPYRDRGQLGRHMRESLNSRPAAVVERSLTTRVEKTMLSR